MRPGRPTAVYLDRVLTRLTLPGAIYLAFVAELPNIVFRYLPESSAFFGVLGWYDRRDRPSRASR